MLIVVAVLSVIEVQYTDGDLGRAAHTGLWTRRAMLTEASAYGLCQHCSQGFTIPFVLLTCSLYLYLTHLQHLSQSNSEICIYYIMSWST